MRRCSLDPYKTPPLIPCPPPVRSLKEIHDGCGRKVGACQLLRLPSFRQRITDHLGQRLAEKFWWQTAKDAIYLCRAALVTKWWIQNRSCFAISPLSSSGDMSNPHSRPEHLLIFGTVLHCVTIGCCGTFARSQLCPQYLISTSSTLSF